MSEDLSKVLEWVRTVNPKALPYDIVSVGWGPKITNGQPTGENSLIFAVEEKKSLESLDPSKIIPDTLDIHSVEVVTDVQKVETLQFYINDCHDISGTIAPVSAHRVRSRPLSGGCEAENRWSQFVGTLGMFVVDKTDGQVVALSNNHVLGALQMVASVNVPNSLNLSNTYYVSGYQPTGQYRTTRGNDFIGLCKRPVPMGNVDDSVAGSNIGITSSDAAILKLRDYSLIDKNSVSIINFSDKGPYKWATDSEIDSLLNPASPNYNSPIFKAGRTTGPIGFPGYSTATCQLSVYSLGPDAYVGFGTPIGDRSSLFSNLFYVRGNGIAPARGGDSGSTYFALLSSNIPSASAWKVLGLLFAGPGDSTFSVGCRITNISADLSIAPWNGVIPTLSSSSSIAISNTNVQTPTITLSGRTYYQIGKTVTSSAQKGIIA